MTNRIARSRLTHGLLFSVLVPLGLLALPEPAKGQGRNAAAALGQYRQQRVTDSQGFIWEFDAAGNISSNVQAFSSSSHGITIREGNSSNGFSVRKQQMSPDGKQYLFTGQCGQFQVRREIKVDAKNATARYLDTITNPQPQEKSVVVDLYMRNRSSNRGVMTSGGQYIQGRAYSGVIPEGQFGFHTVSSSTNYPSVVFFLAGKKGKVRPTVVNTSSSNYRFHVHYAITIPAGKSVTLMHGVAQKRFTSPPAANRVAALFKPFLDRSFTSDIASDVKRQIVNVKIGGGTGSNFGELLAALNLLVDEYEVERGTKDILVVDADSRLPGTISGDSVSVTTRLGKTSVPLDQIAAATGGAGVGKQMTLHLRSGEVLAGDIDLAGIEFEADSGLSFAMESSHIVALFTAARPTDGKPGPQASQWLQTQFGDRLSLGHREGSVIQGVSTWGPIKVPLSLVKSLSRSSDELPIHRLELIDGSNVWMILQGNAVDVDSPTLGKIAVPVAAIDRVGIVKPPPPEETPTPKPNRAAAAANSVPSPGGGTTSPTAPATLAPPSTPTSRAPQRRPLPVLRLLPPGSIPQAIRTSMSNQIKSLLSSLAKEVKAAAGKPLDAAAAQKQFDLMSQAAQLQARIGSYDEALKNADAAKKLKSLDTSKRSAQILMLDALVVAVRKVKAATPPTNDTGTEASTSSPATAPTPSPAPPTVVPLRTTPPVQAPTVTKAKPEAGSSDFRKPVAQSEKEQAPKLKYPTWTLAGENKAVARFRDETVSVLTTAGESQVVTADIKVVKRGDEKQGRVSFSIELKDGSRISGRFSDTVIALTFHGQVWQVPARHIEDFAQPVEFPTPAVRPVAEAADDPAAKP